MKFFVFSLLVVSLAGLILYMPLQSGDVIQTYLEQSVPHVGVAVPRMNGSDGTGIRIAVIDTGVDYTHPDLFGWGPDGKVIGGYNFIDEDQLPMDTDGHGTQVAGIIAADGLVVGIAPKADILAYKVSEDGRGVSSELIIRAIERAVDDKVDIINISLGVNKTNAKIERAVNNALERDIFVVTAAGNDGPEFETIGSPGRNFGSVTVGATYNNLTSSLVATLEVGEESYTVVPMTGSTKPREPIIGEIVFGGYGKIENLKEINSKDAILIVERGSDVDGEMLYFSIKESNAADAGAKALIVYNNEPGFFLGELIHEFIRPGYIPQIPVVSIDREDGLSIIESIEDGREASINLIYNPDSVAHFSSRGPVSPFYIKPEIVAPGAYINSTQNDGGYNFVSGTSYAAPHVSGAVALLLQKNPELSPHEIRSLLLTTVKPVSDAYGQKSSLHMAGAGRLDIGDALGAELIIMPPNFVVSVSSDVPNVKREIRLKPMDGTLDGIDILFEGPEFIKFAHSLRGDTVQIEMNVTGKDFGEHEGRIVIIHKGMTYVTPFLMHYTPGSISVHQENQRLFFEIYHPEEWSFAKISLTDSRDGETYTVTTTPDREASIDIHENTRYWIDAKIRVGGNTSDAFNTIEISSLPRDSAGLNITLPEKQIVIIAGIVIVIGIFGLLRR